MDTIIDFLWDWKWLIILIIIWNQLKKVWNMYNGIQELLQGVHEAKSNIAVILNQKVEIINKFYAVVSQYDGYEKNIQLQVSGDYTQSAKEASKAVAYIHGVAMAYPELKADKNYKMFLDQITSNERALTERREIFNNIVKSYNVYITKLPICFLAKALGYTTKEYFESN